MKTRGTPLVLTWLISSEVSPRFHKATSSIRPVTQNQGDAEDPANCRVFHVECPRGLGQNHQIIGHAVYVDRPRSVRLLHKHNVVPLVVEGLRGRGDMAHGRPARLPDQQIERPVDIVRAEVEQRIRDARVCFREDPQVVLSRAVDFRPQRHGEGIVLVDGQILAGAVHAAEHRLPGVGETEAIAADAGHEVIRGEVVQRQIVATHQVRRFVALHLVQRPIRHQIIRQSLSACAWYAAKHQKARKKTSLKS